MTKCQKEEEKSDEMTLPSHSLLFDFNFLMLLCFTSMERLISPAHATNLYRPDDDLVSNSCNLSYIWFLEVSIKKQALRHHRQVLDGLPAYKNNLSLRTCIS